MHSVETAHEATHYPMGIVFSLSAGILRNSSSLGRQTVRYVLNSNYKSITFFLENNTNER